MPDPFNLNRFLDAQQQNYGTALAEIRRGSKRSHWMWYIFPQISGLGQSEFAKLYEIASLAEARAYLQNPLLSNRLRACVEALQDHTDTTAVAIFGEIDARKLRSSLTLFALAGGGMIFEAALERWFGSPDLLTVELVASDELSPGSETRPII